MNTPPLANIGSVGAAIAFVLFAAVMVVQLAEPDSALEVMKYCLPAGLAICHIPLALRHGAKRWAWLPSGLALIAAAFAGFLFWFVGNNFVAVIENNDASAGAIGVGIMVLAFCIAVIATGVAGLFASVAGLLSKHLTRWHVIIAAGDIVLAALGLMGLLGERSISWAIGFGSLLIWWASVAAGPLVAATLERTPPGP